MNTSMRFPGFLLLLALPVLHACGGGTSAWQGTITDSAGITVVSNPSLPLWADGDEWTVTEDLRIGTVAGDPEYQFGMILPVSSIDVDRQGQIYVMDLQAQDVRVFDAQGEYVRTLGGPGSGPGEISAQAGFVFTNDGDEVLIPDLGNQRVSIFNPDGQLAGSFPIQIQAGVPVRWKMGGSGRIMAQLRGMNVQGMAALAEGDPIVVYDTTGVVVDTIALLPQGQTLAGATQEQFRMVVFAPEPVWELNESGSILYAMNDQYRILVNGPDGNLERIITRPTETKAVEESDKNAIISFIREMSLQQGAPPEQIEPILQGIGFAEFYPAFMQIIVGPGESIWVQRVRSSREMAEAAEEGFEFNFQDIGSPEWDVFDAEGRYLGVVTLPDRFAPVHVDGDHLYGVWANELDVQFVMRLLVERPTS